MKCFVIMPFDQEFDDVYATIKAAVSSSVPGERIICNRLDEIKSAGRISNDLLREIHESTICIADLTHNKPNVMWEVGYVMALNKPVLLITQNMHEVPFDVKDMRFIQYNRQSLTSTLQSQLAQSFRETLGTYEVRRESATLNPPNNFGNIIAITGSMEGNEAKCTRRIDTLLEPYVGKQFTWLCGSYGIADEQVIKFLLGKKEKIIAVGYSSFDISFNILGLVSRNKIPFVDARKEQTPKGILAPSQRDLFFLVKADLVILLWNGNSTGIKRMIEWYSKQQKDHIVGFF